MLQNQWFVVVTHSQRESFVFEQLSQFEPYLPCFKSVKGTLKPLFPGYLFVPSIEHWGSIKSTVGVRQILMAGDDPASLPGKEIAKLKAMERGGIVQLPPPPRFRPGERLTITRGLLRHRVVIHSGMCGKDREKVLIDMLGQNVTIVVASVDLVPGNQAIPQK